MGPGTVTVELGGDEKEVSKCINRDGVGPSTCTTCQGSGIQASYLDLRLASKCCAQTTPRGPHYGSYPEQSIMVASCPVSRWRKMFIEELMNKYNESCGGHQLLEFKDDD
ncbi:hypothetical protein RJ641_028880 [Dillenia turbinata]|uniref:Uncharacterized protein n=1 Tax=Dillenia turbinata TaxID=194707 RepID=A0AAN8VX42_9MAGN